MSWQSWVEWSDATLTIPSLGGVKVKELAGWLQVALGLLAAIGIAVRAFLARRADLELAKQFVATRQIFQIALESLEKVEAHPDKPDWTSDAILERLGREALLEQAEWLWIRHSRPFEIPN